MESYNGLYGQAELLQQKKKKKQLSAFTLAPDQCFKKNCAPVIYNWN